jgi:Swiss Army Knife protein, DSP-PTPase phosphatase domain
MTLPHSYWVEDGRLLAGEYPGDVDAELARARVAALRDAGVTLFLDLTESGESGLLPYAPFLHEELRFIRKPVRDLDVPEADEMREILDLIDAELRAGSVVYMHCWGGVGRAGTVVGCYLVRHGVAPEAAIERIGALRAGSKKAHRASPVTSAQRAMIRAWAAHDRPHEQGSKLQVQIYVNRRPSALTQAVLEQIPSLADTGARLCWISPLEHEAFAEWQDKAFLQAVGLGPLADELATFWPKGGPVWDALAVALLPEGGHDVVLVEAKSHVDELYSGGCKASARSRTKIAAALEQTKQWLGVEPNPEAWMGRLYQTANRYAHLYWLREVARVPTWLVYVLFLDDRTHLGASRQTWEVELPRAKAELGLVGPVPYSAEVFLPALAPIELVAPPRLA